MIDAGVVDANIFLRHVVKGPADQAQAATAFFRKIADEDAVAVLLPTVVLEVVFILERQYKAARREVYDAVQEILQFKGLFVQHQAQLLNATENYLRRPGISFADAYHCEVAKDYFGGVITFDRKLGAVPGVTHIEPA